MPVIKSAIKKLRRDRKVEKANDAFRASLDRALRGAKKKKTGASVVDAMSLVDRAVKKNLMHKNRAARIKSSLSKLAKPATNTNKVATKKAKPTTKASAPKTAAKAAKKTPAKTSKTVKK